MDPAALHAAIVESTDAAIIAKDLSGTILVWNPAAERIFGWTAPEMIGRSIRTIIPPERQAEEDSIIARIVRGERVERFETCRLRKDGSEVSVAVIVSPVCDADGTVVGASKVARDITDDIAARRARENAAERMRLMGDNLPVIAYVTDAAGAALWGNHRYRSFFGIAADQISTYNWAAHIAADQREDALAEARAAAERAEPFESVLRMFDAQRAERWLLVRATPLAGTDGEPFLRFGTATDITEQRQAEERTHTLLKEVNHRTRNMLAMIQSMARRTAATGGDFVPRLESRIAGLAATQDLLVNRDWSGVPIADLVAAQLAVAGQHASRFHLSGPDLVLAPGAAESIGMAINELANNAGRYGALSVAEGRVALHWEVTGTSAEADFVIAWRESGGPVVTEPTMTGFGSKIIEDVPRGKLCGAVEFAYAPEGFHWRLTCPTRLALADPEGE